MDLLKTGLLDGNPLEVQGTTYDSFPVAPLLIVPEVITPSLELNFATGKQLDSRITFSRGSSGTFINENGNVVGKTPGTTSSITPSTTSIGSQVTVTVASGSVIGWAVGQAISLIVDTDGQDDPDAGELWLLGDIVSSTLTTLTFTVTSRTATAGSATSWTLGYRGARFTHNPSTLASLGLLIEESRTNSVSGSDLLTNTSTSNVTRSAVTGTSPSGGNSVASIVENTATSGHNVFASSIALSPQQSLTWSVFLKAGGRTRVRLRFQETAVGNSCQVDFNLQTATVSGAVNSGFATGASGAIETFPNGWYRCALSGRPSASTGTTVSTAIDLLDNSGNSAYAGDGVSGVFAWGAQLEAGAFATSYIPTTSATVTRAADVATMTGTNFSSWYNASQGTFVANAISGNRSPNNARILNNSTGSVTPLFLSSPGGTTSNVGSFDGSSAVTTSNSITNGNAINAASAWSSAGRAVCANGGSVSSTASNAGFNLSGLFFGCEGGAIQFLNGPLARIRYYRRRLPDANLQTLTT